MTRLGTFLGLAALALTGFLVVWAMGAQSRTALREIQQELTAAGEKEAASLQLAQDIADNPRQTGLPDLMAWPHTELEALEQAMQQAVLVLAQQAGLAILNFGLGRVDPSGPLPTISYDAELEGGHVELARFLAALEGHLPAVSVESLWLRQYPFDPLDNVARVSIRARLLAFAPNLERTP
jgi:hypothetical protein